MLLVAPDSGLHVWRGVTTTMRLSHLRGLCGRYRSRTVLVVGVFIVVLHMLVMANVDGGDASLPSSVLKRHVSVLSAVVAGPEAAQSIHHIPAPHHRPQNKDGLRMNADRAIINIPIERQCRSGHIQGLAPICDRNGCMGKLSTPQFTANNPLQTNLLRDLDRNAFKKISSVGNMDNAHISMISEMTHMQWTFGVYGSVGEIGTSNAQFAAVLVHNMASAVGETAVTFGRFDSDADGGPSAAGSRLRFDSVMKMCNINVVDTTLLDDSEPVVSQLNTINIYTGPINKHALAKYNIPQFRIVGINNRQSGYSMHQLLHQIQQSTCLLRDGGLIIIDGVESNDAILEIIRRYFDEDFHTNSVLSPLLLMKDRLYLSTTNRREQYGQYILNNHRMINTYNLREDTTQYFGSTFKYFTAQNYSYKR